MTLALWDKRLVDLTVGDGVWLLLCYGVGVIAFTGILAAIAAWKERR